jgi:hypothetical protein
MIWRDHGSKHELERIPATGSDKGTAKIMFIHNTPRIKCRGKGSPVTRTQNSHASTVFTVFFVTLVLWLKSRKESYVMSISISIFPFSLSSFN